MLSFLVQQDPIDVTLFVVCPLMAVVLLAAWLIRTDVR